MAPNVTCTVDGNPTPFTGDWKTVQTDVEQAMQSSGGTGEEGHTPGHTDAGVTGGGRRRRRRTRRHRSRRHHGRRHRRRSRRHGKGSKSLTHHGDMNYTTKRGNKDFHRRHHDVKKSRSPYRKRRRSRKARGAYSFF